MLLTLPLIKMNFYQVFYIWLYLLKEFKSVIFFYA